ncbi:MAG TPA: ABC transporter permease [Gammaproteobacteria bacterium]
MLWNALLMALRSIRRNLLRSALTTLGIVIGVAAVISMVNVGSGTTAQVSAQIGSLGSNLLMVRPGQYMGGGGRINAKPFDEEDALAIEREVSGLRGVAPSASRRLTLIYGNTSWNSIVNGTNNDYMVVRDWPLASGRNFSESELRSGAAVCIIGETIRRELYGSQDPVGTKLRIKNISCEVIGLLAPKGQSAMGSDQDENVLMPLRTFWRRIAGNQDVSLIQISAREGVSTAKVKNDVEALLRERRRIGPDEDDNFMVNDMKEIAATLTGTTKVLTGLLGAVAAVSLLVGGIGIMNIMLVSVTERTREIGIRLAIGATEREVLMQFLVESVVLSLFGGIIGILLASLMSWGLSKLMQVPLVFDPLIFIVAFFFSAAIGIIFGYFPARRAAQLDPIEALRHE